jgi:hypothetical protein
MKKKLLFLLLVCVIACQKRVANTTHVDPRITQARTYFNSVLARNIQTNKANFRANQVRAAAWDQAEVRNLSVGSAVIVPITFQNKLNVATDLASSYLLNLSQITKLVIFQDASGQYHYQVLTLIPDSSSILHPGTFTGIALTEDWSGNSLVGPQRIGQSLVTSGTSQRPIVADEFAITTCDDISGYNYAAGDAENGETWEETSCTTYDLGGGGAEGGNIGLSSGDYSDVGGGGGGSATTMLVAPPASHIASVAAYFDCFTNVGGSDHSYTVTLAIQQPVPGTRDAWTIVSGGPTGSTQASNIFNVGHTFLIFTESYGNTTITRNIGFYPAVTVRPSSPSSSGEFSDDENHPYNISGSYTVNNAQFYQMLNFVESVNSSSYLYNLNSNNCSTFAINTLAQAGFNLPRTVGTWPGGSGNDPGDLGEDIRTGNIPNMSVNIAPSATHVNVGQCN